LTFFTACLLRGLATEASAISAAPEVAQVDAALSKKTVRPILHTGIILNRSPIITRTPTAFEKAYYAYQARIHRSLQNPFPYEFYFKQGSPLESRFNIEERRRERKAFGAPFGMQKGETSEAEKLAEATMRDEEEAMPRIHEADIHSDFKHLNRRGQRNLYLLLQKQETGAAVWRFPEASVEKGELLHHVSHFSVLPCLFLLLSN
jgi:large subunit ribosomal protein L46